MHRRSRGRQRQHAKALAARQELDGDVGVGVAAPEALGRGRVGASGCDVVVRVQAFDVGVEDLLEAKDQLAAEGEMGMLNACTCSDSMGSGGVGLARAGRVGLRAARTAESDTGEPEAQAAIENLVLMGMPDAS